VAGKLTLRDQASLLRYIAQTATVLDGDPWITIDGAFAPDLDHIAEALLLIDFYGIPRKVRDRARRDPGKAPKPQRATRKMSITQQEMFVRDLRAKLSLRNGKISARVHARSDRDGMTGIETVAHTLDLMAAYGAANLIQKEAQRMKKRGRK